MAMCAQVYVHTDKHFGERNDDEEAMLDEAYQRFQIHDWDVKSPN